MEGRGVKGPFVLYPRYPIFRAWRGRPLNTEVVADNVLMREFFEDYAPLKGFSPPTIRHVIKAFPSRAVVFFGGTVYSALGEAVMAEYSTDIDVALLGPSERAMAPFLGSGKGVWESSAGELLTRVDVLPIKDLEEAYTPILISLLLQPLVVYGDVELVRNFLDGLHREHVAPWGVEMAKAHLLALSLSDLLRKEVVCYRERGGDYLFLGWKNVGEAQEEWKAVKEKVVSSGSIKSKGEAVEVLSALLYSALYGERYVEEVLDKVGASKSLRKKVISYKDKLRERIHRQTGAGTALECALRRRNGDPKAVGTAPRELVRVALQKRIILLG